MEEGHPDTIISLNQGNELPVGFMDLLLSELRPVTRAHLLLGLFLINTEHNHYEFEREVEKNDTEVTSTEKNLVDNDQDNTNENEKNVNTIKISGYHYSMSDKFPPESIKKLILSNIIRLDLNYCGIGDTAVAAIASSPYFSSSLKSLNLQDCEIDSKCLTHLTQSTSLSNIISLNLSSNSGIGPEGALILAKSTNFTQLEHLFLSQCALTSTGLKNLSSGPVLLSKLKTLELNTNDIGPPGLEAFNQPSGIINPSLERLELAFNSLTNIESLTNSPILANIKHLNLQYCDLDETGVQLIAESPYLQKLTFLDLRESFILAGGIQIITQNTPENAPTITYTPNRPSPVDGSLINVEKKRSNFSDLETLLLDDCLISDDGAIALAQCPYLGKLTKLDLYYNEISSDGAKALSQSQFLGGSLQQLNISCNSIGDEGLIALSHPQSFPKLVNLSVCENSIGDDGIKGMVDHGMFDGKLKVLNLDRNNITSEGFKALIRSPDCQTIRRLDLAVNQLGSDGMKVLNEYSDEIIQEGKRNGNNGITIFPSLRHLDLEGNSIGDLGAQYFSNSTSLSNRLSRLSLADNNIQFDGAKALTESSYFDKLDRLANECYQRTLATTISSSSKEPHTGQIDTIAPHNNTEVLTHIQLQDQWGRGFIDAGVEDEDEDDKDTISGLSSLNLSGNRLTLEGYRLVKESSYLLGKTVLSKPPY